jgi:ribonuclease BN (tRNA processing enzyme)
MDIRILGAHNRETSSTRCLSLLIDGKLAVDAGGLTSRLALDEQAAIQALVITHYHMDHIRDIPSLALNFYRCQASFDLYATAPVRQAIEKHLLNGEVCSQFQCRPENNPAVRFNEVEPLLPRVIDGYTVKPVPVKHSPGAVGYQISGGKDKTLFFTGDTGPGLGECWRQTRPQLLIMEVTVNNAREDFARMTNHLTPGLLEAELAGFRAVNGYLPPILAIHMDAGMEPEIKTELEGVKDRLGADINLAFEGMRLTL